MTHNGYGDMVVMSIEAYERGRFENEAYQKLMESALESENYPKLFTHDEVFGPLRQIWQNVIIKNFIANHLQPPINSILEYSNQRIAYYDTTGSTIYGTTCNIILQKQPKISTILFTAIHLLLRIPRNYIMPFLKKCLDKWNTLVIIMTKWKIWRLAHRANKKRKRDS